MTPPRNLPLNRRIRPSEGDDTVEEPAGVGAPNKHKATKGAEPRKRSRDEKPRGPGPLRRSLSAIRQRLQTLRAAASIVFVVAASIALAWGIKEHVMNSPRFAVKTVRVDGTVRRTPEQVAEIAGLTLGMNIFAADLENARRRVLQDPWIAEAQIQRKLPTTVTMQVTEREAAAVVAVDADLYLCTHEGDIFKRVEAEDPSDLVVITGLSAAQVATDRTLAIKRIRTALELLSSYEQRGPAKVYPPQEVHIATDGTMRMSVGKSSITLEMGRTPYRMKVLRAARVLNEVKRRSADPAVVYLDNEAHPERVVVRMR